MSGWSCPHEETGRCTRVAGRPCDPGMKGCILAGRFRFTNPGKNRDGAAPLGEVGEDEAEAPTPQTDVFPRYRRTPGGDADER